MTGKERVLAALQHREVDGIPHDLGGMPVSSIALATYSELEQHLGLEASLPRLYMPFNQSVEVSDRFLSLFPSDTLPLYLGPGSWRRELLPSGAGFQLPSQWVAQQESEDTEVVVDDHNQPFARRPRGGHYWHRTGAPLGGGQPLQVPEPDAECVNRLHVPFYLDEKLADFGARARQLRSGSSRFIIGNFHFSVLGAALRLRGWEAFLMDLVSDRTSAEALMEVIVNAHLEWFARFTQAAGGCFDAVLVGDDLGQQNAPLISPRLYRRVVKPFHRRLLDGIRRQSDVFIVFHSDGAVAEFIPDLIEMGVSALNPVQDSAAGMSLDHLKHEFGRDLTFWGGGCDTQDTLPHGTAAQVRDEVRRRIDLLAPGGGFVFAPVHSVPVGTPPENIVAMYETVCEAR